MPEATFHWLDVEEIGLKLCETYPKRDPLRVGFVELKRLVMSLPGFKEQPGHPCNERILEEIQRHWIEERQGHKSEED